MKSNFEKALDGIQKTAKKQEITFLLDGEEIVIFFEKKAVKNINLRLRRDGSFSLSAPTGVQVSAIRSFLEKALPFLLQARKKWQDRQTERSVLCARDGERFALFGSEVTVERRKGQKNACMMEGVRLVLCLREPLDDAAALRTLKRFLDQTARAYLTCETARIAPLFLREPPALCFRGMKSKWGICRPQKNQITLNTSLVFLPPALVEYVIFHEMAHFRHANHSKAFWEWLASFLPDCKQRRKALSAVTVPEFEI